MVPIIKNTLFLLPTVKLNIYFLWNLQNKFIYYTYTHLSIKNLEVKPFFFKQPFLNTTDVADDAALM